MQICQWIVRFNLALAAIAGPTAAQAESRVTVFLGTGASFGLYEDAKTEFRALPYLSYENGPLTVGLDGLRYRLNMSDHLDVTLGVSPRGAPDFPDTSLFDGLNRDATLEALLSMEYRFASDTRFTLAVQRDLLGEHGGTELSAGLGRAQQMGAIQLESQAGLIHRSAALNAYLVGVSGKEVSAQRSAYSPGATTAPYASLSATLPVSARSAFIGSVSYEHLGSAYRDSPLVEGGSSLSVSFGIGHAF